MNVAGLLEQWRSLELREHLRISPMRFLWPSRGGERLGRSAAYPSPFFILGKVLNALLLDPINYDLGVMRRFNRLWGVLEATLTDEEMHRVSAVLEETRGVSYRRLQALVFHPSQDIGDITTRHAKRLAAKSLPGVLMALSAQLRAQFEPDPPRLDDCRFSGHAGLADSRIPPGKMDTPRQAPPATYGKQLRRATYASVLTALVLIAVKLLAWLWTGSVSMLASLVDSLMDSIASAINLVAVRYSLVPADAEHRFGHGKAEPLAGLAQAGFVCGSAVFLLFHAIDRLRFPRPLHDIEVGIAVMVFSIVVTAGLLTLQRSVIRQTESTAIRADALHYATDLLTNLAVIAGLGLASLGWAWADSVFAIGIAAYIFYSAIRIGSEAFQQLMDRELEPEVQQKILAIARAHPDVVGVHDLRTRRSGRLRFVQLHLELDDSLPLARAHAVADEVEERILALLPHAEVIIHQDPVAV